MATGHPWRTWARRAAVPAVLLAWVVLSIDDWGRDFTAYAAEIQEGGPSGRLRPLVSTRPTEQLVEASRFAALRVGGFAVAGVAIEGEVTSVTLVRTTRPFGLHDDVTLRIHDQGTSRVVTGRSVSRLHVGDLGRNPRNLHRLFAEMDAVLDNAARDPAPFSAYRP